MSGAKTVAAIPALYAHLRGEYRETVTITAFGRTTTVTMQPIECVMKTETVTAWIHCLPDTTYTVLGNQTVTILRETTISPVFITTTVTYGGPQHIQLVTTTVTTTVTESPTYTTTRTP